MTLQQAFGGPPVPVLARQIAGSEAHYRPIRLKQVLARYGIQQAEWRAALRQESAESHRRGFSQPMGSMILNWGIWPKRTPAETIKTETNAFLRRRGVPESELGDPLWQELPWEQAAPRALQRLRTEEPRAVTPGAETENPHVTEQEIPREMLSHKAKRQFKLFRDPFVDDVQGPDDVYLSDDGRVVREAMFFAAKHGGFLAVIGESGAGKSVLRRDLIERIRRENEQITCILPRIIDKARLTSGAICDAITLDISKEAPRRSLEGKARQIESLLMGSGRAGNSHVLIIEEAHDLHIETLKYMKRFWEMEDGFRRLLSIILIGQPELKDRLDENRNWSAREVIRRIEVAELEPLNGNLEEYLTLKFKRLNKGIGEVFAADAFDMIRERLKRSGLYPLGVNNFVVKCMNLAADIGEQKITAEVVKGV